jgi:hypothetical protein
MKWNWGTKLLIAIIIFMSFIFVLVYLSTQNDIFLVEKDYYPKGLKYQDRIDNIANAKPLRNQFKFQQLENDVTVTFPNIAPDSGTITFFRPSGTSYDLIYQIDPDTAMTMRFPKSRFIKGKYLIKIYWRENDTGYYYEKPFYFN